MEGLAHILDKIVRGVRVRRNSARLLAINGISVVGFHNGPSGSSGSFGDIVFPSSAHTRGVTICYSLLQILSGHAGTPNTTETVRNGPIQRICVATGNDGLVNKLPSTLVVVNPISPGSLTTSRTTRETPAVTPGCQNICEGSLSDKTEAVTEFIRV